MRYRLRFHLQEVDLATDEVVVGRGPDCHVTIDDPMLSRRHVRIVLGDEGPTVEDLESRNGTQLNGAPLRGRASLEDGDRIRLGAQELVFVAQRESKRNFRTTSGLIFCTACALPYPSSGRRCPHCGEAAVGHAGANSERDVGSSGWTFHLLSQVVERAIDQGRLADAERMLARGLSELDGRLDEEHEVDETHLAAIAECATRLGCALRTSRWLDIGVKLYGRAGTHPSAEVLALLDALPSDPRLAEVVERLRRAA